MCQCFGKWMQTSVNGITDAVCHTTIKTEIHGPYCFDCGPWCPFLAVSIPIFSKFEFYSNFVRQYDITDVLKRPSAFHFAFCRNNLIKAIHVSISPSYVQKLKNGDDEKTERDLHYQNDVSIFHDLCFNSFPSFLLIFNRDHTVQSHTFSRKPSP